MNDANDQLDPEEQEILETSEQGELTPVNNAEALMQEAQAVARARLEKADDLDLQAMREEYDFSESMKNPYVA
jgi:hypothetical protein